MCAVVWLIDLWNNARITHTVSIENFHFQCNLHAIDKIPNNGV